MSYVYSWVGSSRSVKWLSAGWTTGTRFPRDAGNLSFPPKTRPAPGPTLPHLQRSSRVKHPDHEADCSPSSCAKVKNVWSFISIPDVYPRCVVYTQGTIVGCTFIFYIGLVQHNHRKIICRHKYVIWCSLTWWVLIQCALTCALWHGELWRGAL
jgi:hypothetical protein